MPTTANGDKRWGRAQWQTKVRTIIIWV